MIKLGESEKLRERYFFGRMKIKKDRSFNSSLPILAFFDAVFSQNLVNFFLVFAVCPEIDNGCNQCDNRGNNLNALRHMLGRGQVIGRKRLRNSARVD